MQFRFPGGELTTWASLGAVTDRSVRVWLRAPNSEAHTATLEIDDRPAAETTLRPAPDHDWVAAADLELEQPRPNAEFRVRVADMVRGGRLAPAVDEPAAFTFAFASCHQPFKGNAHERLGLHEGIGIYDAMRQILQQRGAHFQLLLGDQIYSDGVPPIHLRDDVKKLPRPPSDEELRELYRHIYRGYFNETGFRTLLERVPSVMIWDDHDIFDGWGSTLDGDQMDERLFKAAEATYREYQHLRNHGASLDDSAPYSYTFWFGNVGFFVFDLRGVRDYNEGTLLGARQWRDFRRFLEQADERDTPTLFLGSSIPIVHFSPTFVDWTERLHTRQGLDIRDRWSVDPFIAERNALLERLFDWQTARPGRQIVVLSGDVHVGAAFRFGPCYRAGELLQWTSSPLSTRTTIVHRAANWIGTHFVNLGESRYRAKREALDFSNNFGLVEVEPLPESGHEVRFRLFEFNAKKQRAREAARIATRPRSPARQRMVAAR